jgi:hypothetical protein
VGWWVPIPGNDKLPMEGLYKGSRLGKPKYLLPKRKKVEIHFLAHTGIIITIRDSFVVYIIVLKSTHCFE